jgi:hypothetical protein
MSQPEDRRIVAEIDDGLLDRGLGEVEALPQLSAAARADLGGPAAPTPGQGGPDGAGAGEGRRDAPPSPGE